MKNRVPRVALAAAAFLVLVVSARAQGAKCVSINGLFSETITATSQVPNDPFGRVVGTFVGDFAGVTDATVTSFLVSPPLFSGPSGPPGVIQVRHVFNTGPGESVNTLGRAAFIPSPVVLPAAIAANPGSVPGTTAAPVGPSQCPLTPCVVTVSQVLDIIGGTGRFAGATGQLRNLGQGNLDLVNGKGQFAFISTGEICLADTAGLTVSSLSFDPSSVTPGGSFNATFSGARLTTLTYFDVKFRTPGGTVEQEALNWQQGTSATHPVPSSMQPGVYAVTAVRAHTDAGDHGSSYVPVSANITVRP